VPPFLRTKRIGAPKGDSEGSKKPIARRSVKPAAAAAAKPAAAAAATTTVAASTTTPVYHQRHRLGCTVKAILRVEQRTPQELGGA
jgi:hypothetical protein